MYAQDQQRPGYGQPHSQSQSGYGQGYQPPSYQPPQPAAYQNPNQASNYGTAHEPLKTSHRSASLPSGDEIRFQPAGCRDFIWALLFVVHFIGMIILAIVMFRKYKDDMTRSDNTNNQNTNSSDDLKLNTHGWVLIIILLVCSFFVAGLWLSFMQRFPRQLIWFCLIWSCVTTFAFAAFFFAKGEIVPAIIFAICGALNVLYVYFVRHRIAFSATMLEVMSKVIKQYPSTVGVAAGGILFQAAWVFIWSIGAGTTLYAVRNDTSMNPNLARLIYAFLILSFYWTSQVIVNVVHVTVAGTVASWYFLYPDAMPVHPTLKSLKRATWSSFGSICLGSLIVAVIKTARYMVNAARDTKHEIIRCIILCLLDCLDRMVQFFNTYAYTQVAIYGKNYCEAAQDTWQLLKGRGWDLVINSDLTGSVLALGSVVGGCIVAIIGGIFASVVWKMPLWGVWAMLGFFIGFVVSQLAMEVMRSAIACMYVCYAEDPNALQHTKPHIYDQFTGNIRANYPGVYTGSVQHV